MSLSDDQFAAITAAERATSILSVIGTTIVIGTFLSSSSFRKPINRVVFYASWGNIMTNVGTLISRAAIVQKEHGEVLCRFQAFIIQWFMPADALWTFAMAFNVYLTFFHKYDAAKLRRLEWKYLVLCYGLPFIPPFAYFFISTSSKGPVYGSALLWCWVAVDWDILRIAVFYGPVWFVILLTFAIYARVGIDIAQKRRTLRRFNKEANMMMDDRLNKLFEIHASKVVHVTSEAANGSSPNGQTQATKINSQSSSSGSSSHVNASNDTNDASNTTAFPAYSVTVAGGEAFPLSPSATSTVGTASVKVFPTSSRRHQRMDISSAAFAYCKYAVLYFVVLLITWVPSTINRVYSLIYPTDAIFGLEFVSAFVLPLQGFWNSIIYIAVSWSTVKGFVHQFRARRQPSPQSAGEMRLKQYFSNKSENRGSQVGRRVSDTESTTHFAKDAEGVQGI